MKRDNDNEEQIDFTPLFEVLHTDEPVFPPMEIALPELAAKQLKLRAAKFKREGELKAINEELFAVTETMNGILATNQCTKFDYDQKLFYQKINSHPSIKPEKKDAFIQWLDEQNEGGIAQRTIHPKTLKSWYDQAPEELHEALAEFLETFQKIDIYVKGDHGKEQVEQAYRDFKAELG